LVSQLEIRGAIEVGPKQILPDLDGQTITLKLDDGRCLEAKVKHGDPVTGHWEIEGIGDRGLAPC